MQVPDLTFTYQLLELSLVLILVPTTYEYDKLCTENSYAPGKDI